MELNNYNVSKIILIGGEPLMFDGINKLVVFVRKIFPNAKIFRAKYLLSFEISVSI